VTQTVTLPARRDDLVIRQISDDEVVIKVPARREYFSVGPAENFLLRQLDGSTTADDLCRAFETEFGESLTDQDIDEFLEIVRSRGLLEDTDGKSPSRSKSKHKSGSSSKSRASSTSRSSGKSRASSSTDEEDDDDELSGQKQSVLFFRVPLFDPHRLFCWLEPKIRWVWTKSFLAVSALTLLFAFSIVCLNGNAFASSFSQAMRWETIAVVWGTIIFATVLHEFAHGLTCRHFGGEVHDTGVLFMFFIPCLYCNVSDAWLIPERRRRLLITAAGGYCDLCLWALSVFVWRVTVQDCFLNHLAFVTQAVCGGRGLLNFNPLLRLDGYYIVSDWLTIPNLRKRAHNYWMEHLRWLLWGAPKPLGQQHSRALLIYGIMSWCFAIFFLDMIFVRLLAYVGKEFGLVGSAFLLLLMAFALRRIFKGLFKSECATMIKARKTRTMIWVASVAAVLLVPFVIPVPHYATGNFEVRPAIRFEVPAPVTGFIARIHVDEGAEVSAGDILVELASPDLTANLATKQSELRESEASLTQLTLGTRPEEIVEQRKRIERLTAWCEQGRIDVGHARRELQQQIVVDNARVTQAQLQIDAARKSLKRSEWLHGQGALAGSQLQAQKTNLQLLQGQLLQAQAELQARQLNGTRVTEDELARREQSLAEAQSALSLQLAGTRPEVIAAEEARRERILKELAYLKAQEEQLIVRAPASGVIATPRFREKIGLLAVQGIPICAIEDGSLTRVELAVDEHLAVGIVPGQSVILKARALPMETIRASVERVAPATVRLPESLNNVLIVHCQLENGQQQLSSGMTGFGRVVRGSRTLGKSVGATMMGYIRTEFWW